MDNKSLLSQINELVEQEHALREKIASELGHSPEDKQTLKDVETQLDQCWDLLRQRRALHKAFKDEDQARLRSPEKVEGYRQ